MGYRRYISNEYEDAREFSFDLVLRTSDNQHTYGGGRVVIQKDPQQPLSDAFLEATLNQAILKIVKEGDKAYPKNLAFKVSKDSPSARYLKHMARQKNIEDWPTLFVKRVRGGI